MASEELQSSHPQLGSPNLPLYPEMILSAIEALNEKNGSNKSSICKKIESTYGNLPPTFSTLLTHHLNRMKSSGQLVFMKNNYLKPDPNAPPRRGRGRPPKAKSALPQEAAAAPSSPRPRGRPPKSKAIAPSTENLSGKKRGRPSKASSGEVASTDLPPPPLAVTGEKPRGRGRPPKVKPAVAATVGA
ncbi:hypothetical protein ACJIZ3_020272 [Penstemon smallii]|uniref:HMG-Y-related protein A n=1 Tax=Penstemon smallii TaxID=265156 RepID=A0ABD3SIC5_9LAMI